MHQVKYSPDDYQAGKILLAQLLPEAKLQAEKMGGETVMNSARAIIMAEYIREENFDSIIIYKSINGWHCDLVLKNVPSNVSNVLGSPMEIPFPTFQDAYESAKIMLASIIQFTKIEPPKIFKLFNIGFVIVPEILEKMRDFSKKIGIPLEGYGSKENAAVRIEEVLQEIFEDDERSVENFKNINVFQQSKLMSALHVASLDGLMEYPIPPKPVMH